MYFVQRYTPIFLYTTNEAKRLCRITCLYYPNNKGWVVHDCWSSYFKCTGIKHALCEAHLLRELTSLVEQGSGWAKLFGDYLICLYEMSENGKSALGEKEQQDALVKYDAIMKLADEIEAKPVKVPGQRGRPKSTKGRNLIRRLTKHKSAVIAFAFHEEVPFTNNWGERDLRNWKTKLNVAGCFRTLEYAQYHAQINSYISTVRKHKLNVFSEIKSAFRIQEYAPQFLGAK